eukprot:10855411-Alexandrium_andersonii.AAC.1
MLLVSWSPQLRYVGLRAQSLNRRSDHLKTAASDVLLGCAGMSGQACNTTPRQGRWHGCTSSGGPQHHFMMLPGTCTLLAVPCHGLRRTQERS